MKVEEPKFLTIAEILYLHDESLARFGGSAGIGDRGLVESASGAAQNTFWCGHGDLFEIAAAYAFHIAESQAFIDGKKNCRRVGDFVFAKERHFLSQRRRFRVRSHDRNCGKAPGQERVGRKASPVGRIGHLK